MTDTTKFLFDTVFDSAVIGDASGAKLLTAREIQSLRDSAFLLDHFERVFSEQDSASRNRGTVVTFGRGPRAKR